MPERILVRGVNWIGDAVMTMPSLKSLRKAYRDSKISLLVKPSVAPVFAKCPTVDEVIVYEPKFGGVFGKLRLASRLRKERFSKAILLQNAFDAAAIAFLAGVPERMGYNRDGRGFLLTRAVQADNADRKIHHMQYYLNLLAALGIKSEPSRPWINLSLEERLVSRNVLSGMKRPLLGINPGAAYGPAKRWLPGRFAEVGEWFIRDTGGSVVIFGAGNEAAIAEEIGKKIISSPMYRRRGAVDEAALLNLAGRASLRELIALISECEVFLTNDTGPMHVAYAVGTPLVALFGSTDPRLTGFDGNGGIMLKNDFDCSPCFERTCRTGDLRCMYSISSDEVFLEVKRMLPSKRAVFFDRDGTLCEDVNYLSRWEDFKLLPGMEELARLKTEGFQVLGASNQSGIARGLIKEDFVKDVNKVFIEKFGFDDFYYCPHHPDDYCSCRKPEPGMLHCARSERGIDLRKSYMVGDKDLDMILARAVGARAVFVRSGKEKESVHADVAVDGLSAAVEYILNDERKGGL